MTVRDLVAAADSDLSPSTVVKRPKRDATQQQCHTVPGVGHRRRSPRTSSNATVQALVTDRRVRRPRRSANDVPNTALLSNVRLAPPSPSSPPPRAPSAVVTTRTSTSAVLPHGPLLTKASNATAAAAKEKKKANVTKKNTITDRKLYDLKRPLKGKTFLLDIENKRARDKTEKDLRKLGAAVDTGELNLDRPPLCLVTDCPKAKIVEDAVKRASRKNGVASKGRNGPAAQSLVDQMATSSTSRLANCSMFGSSSGRRKSGGCNKPTDRIPPPLTERERKGLTPFLRDAVDNGIRIKSLSEFTAYLEKFAKKIRNSRESAKSNAPIKLHHGAEDKAITSRPRKLCPPFIKFQDERGEFCALYKEFHPPTNWYPVYLKEYIGKSPFHKASPRKIQNRINGVASPGPVKARKSTAGAPRKLPMNDLKNGPPLPNKGHCEICGIFSQDIVAHLSSSEHRRFIRTPGFYDELDQCLDDPFSEDYKDNAWEWDSRPTHVPCTQSVSASSANSVQSMPPIPTTPEGIDSDSERYILPESLLNR